MGSVALLVRGGDLTSGAIYGLEADRAQRLAESVIGRPLDTTFVVIFQSADLSPEDEAFSSAMQETLEPLRHDAAVSSVQTADDAPAPIALTMANQRGAFATVTLKGDFRDALRAYPRVREALRSNRLLITCTGRVPFANNLDRTLEHDLRLAETVSLPLAILVLILVFRSLVAAILPVAVGALAVVGGIALIVALSGHLEVAQYTINVCSIIGLGVAIDYSLFTVSRYREELAVGFDTFEALRRTVARTGPMVAFSGLAVATGLAGLLFFRGSFLWSIGIGGAIVVLLAVVFALTFLPALLAVLGPRINAGRVPLIRLGPRAGFWHGVAHLVMGHPVAVLVPTLALLLAMGAPFLHLRLAGTDPRILPATAESRHGFDLLTELFPEQAKTRFLVAVRFPTLPLLNAERIGALTELDHALQSLPGVSTVDSLVSHLPVSGREATARLLLDPPATAVAAIEEAKKLAIHDDVALVLVTTDRPPESAEARAIVEAIRSHRQVADGELLVGGPTALDLDATHYLQSRAPLAIGLVVATTLVVLFLLLGSVLLPIKAVLMNLLSISGSFGAMVWIFQDGHLGIKAPRPLDPSLPVLLFCILFGLSMDYEVLMLSRMKEIYERTKDNTQAVAEGLEHTATLITSAAAIMIAVFTAFSLASVVVIKAVGVGMSLAVAVDATLVRVLLVPATMRLFGDLNWWAPLWLLRLRRRLT